MLLFRRQGGILDYTCQLMHSLTGTWKIYPNLSAMCAEVTPKLIHAKEVTKYFRAHSSIFQFSHFCYSWISKDILFISLILVNAALPIKSTVKSPLVSYFWPAKITRSCPFERALIQWAVTFKEWILQYLYDPIELYTMSQVLIYSFHSSAESRTTSFRSLSLPISLFHSVVCTL